MSNHPKRTRSRKRLHASPNEMALRGSLPLLPLEVTQELLDDIITQLDEFETEDDYFGNILAAQVKATQDHAIASGDSAEEALKAGLGRDLVVMHLMLIHDWAEASYRTLVALREAHMVG